jgi:hypothetical protein
MITVLIQTVRNDILFKDNIKSKRRRAMKAQDLRIGNWVQFRHTETPVLITLADFVREYKEEHLEDYEPIPLTEDWLEKFGFELTYESKFRRCFDLDTSIGFLSFNFSKVIQEKDNVSIASLNLKWASLKYVHQLQNLYFALTGKELQTDETKKKVKE